MNKIFNFKSRSEEFKLFKKLIDSSSDSFFVANGNGEFVYVNETACNRLGFTNKELFNLKVWDVDIVYLNTQEKFKNTFENLIENKTFTIETFHKRKDNSTYSAEVKFSLITFKGENCILGVAKDITEKESQEKELFEAKNRLTLALKGSNEGLWDVDIKNNRVYYSPQWKQMLGYEDSEIENDLKIFYKLLHRDDKKFVIQEIERIEKFNLVTIQMEFRLKCKDGEYKWILSRGGIYYNQNGDAIRAVGHHIDITRQKLLEDALKKKEKEALFAKEKAESASQAKSIFLSNMSHELRTPMNSVLGYAELLKNSTLNKEQKNYIKQLIESGSYMIQLINDILDISKIEAGKLELHKSDFSLYDLINFVNNNFAKEALKRKIELIIEHNLPEKIFVKGDKAKLFQVLLNLVGNSIKFTKEGYVKVVIKKEKNNIYYFEVSDSGIGIDEEELKDIFQIFYKSKDITYQGTGLGLAICKKNIELMDGVLKVESKKDIGTKFYFSIYLEISKEIENHKEKITYKNCKKTMLIVDDEVKNIEILKMILSKRGFIVYEANNGEDGIKVYKGEKPDIVLMDIVMPQMDGIECAKKIKDFDLKAKIIAMTAHVFNKEIPKSIFDDVIFKPIKFNELIDKIQNSFKDKDLNKNILNKNICNDIDSDLKIEILESALIGNFTKLKKLIEKIKDSKCGGYLIKLLNEFDIEAIVKEFKGRK